MTVTQPNANGDKDDQGFGGVDHQWTHSTFFIEAAYAPKYVERENEKMHGYSWC